MVLSFLFASRFVELFSFAGIFCMLSLWGKLNVFVALEFFCFKSCLFSFCYSLVFSRVFEQP